MVYRALGPTASAELDAAYDARLYRGIDRAHEPEERAYLLRRWRDQRRMTQTDLAVAAESSTRHLSCLETGKAQPSREMVIRLAEYLNIPLRDRNTLLLAAGFAPAFTERSVDELEAAKGAIESVLRAHSPLPAFAVDRHWNVVLSNGALPQPGSASGAAGGCTLAQIDAQLVEDHVLKLVAALVRT